MILLINSETPIALIQQIADIYNYYVTDTVATFDLEPISREDMVIKVLNISASYPYYVAVEDDLVVGYAYANTWNTRPAYAGTVETSIYLRHDQKAKGIGTALYTKLLDRLNELGYHTAIGGITLPNEASQRLHEKFGYVKSAHYNEVGNKFDQWLDVGYWQKKF